MSKFLWAAVAAMTLGCSPDYSDELKKLKYRQEIKRLTFELKLCALERDSPTGLKARLYSTEYGVCQVRGHLSNFGLRKTGANQQGILYLRDGQKIGGWRCVWCDVIYEFKKVPATIDTVEVSPPTK